MVEACFFGKGAEKKLEKGERISVHCIAGLGRAPVLVAIALIEFAAMEPLHAVTVIRASRRGAINMKQLRRVRDLHGHRVLLALSSAATLLSLRALTPTVSRIAGGLRRTSQPAGSTSRAASSRSSNVYHTSPPKARPKASAGAQAH